MPYYSYFRIGKFWDSVQLTSNQIELIRHYLSNLPLLFSLSLSVYACGNWWMVDRQFNSITFESSRVDKGFVRSSPSLCCMHRPQTTIGKFCVSVKTDSRKSIENSNSNSNWFNTTSEFPVGNCNGPTTSFCVSRVEFSVECVCLFCQIEIRTIFEPCSIWHMIMNNLSLVFCFVPLFFQCWVCLRTTIYISLNPSQTERSRVKFMLIRISCDVSYHVWCVMSCHVT